MRLYERAKVSAGTAMHSLRFFLISFAVYATFVGCARPQPLAGSSSGAILPMVQQQQGDGTWVTFPAANAGYALGLGADGAMWYCAGTTNIVRMDMFGNTTTYSLPTGQATGCYDLTLNRDHTLYFIQYGYSNNILVGHINTAGVVAYLTLSQPIAAGTIFMTEGGDGNLWIASEEAGGANNSIMYRVTTAGTVTEFPLPGKNVQEIATGADGRIWIGKFYRRRDGGFIARVDLNGMVTDYTVGQAWGLAPTHDGRVGLLGYKSLNRLDPTTRSILSYPLSKTSQDALFVGPNSVLFYADGASPIYMHIYDTKSRKLAGAVVLPGSGYPVSPITRGSDSNMWLITN